MELRQARAGRPFTIAIRDAIDEAKDGDPLRAVTVIGPSNSAGLSLRRLLGSNLLDDTPRLGPAGIANVAFATPFQFASTVAANDLAASGRRPLTTAVLASAVRHVLRTNAGRFKQVAQHMATESALVRVYGEITELNHGQRAELAAKSSVAAADLLRLIEAISTHLESASGGVGYHDELAVFEAASRLLESGSGVGESIVLAGPFSQGSSAIGFLEVVARRHNGIAVAALTGDPAVDRASVGQLVVITGSSQAADSVDLAVPTELIPAADSDEEVRAVVRNVLRLAEEGHRFDRMAVFHPLQNPYARTLREQLGVAGVPTAGPDHRRLADTMVGRLLVRVLALAAVDSTSRDKRFDREGVLALVAAAPIRGADGKRVRAGAWENISRSAGVVGGLDDWRHKLARHEDNLIAKQADPDIAGRAQGFLDRLDRERTATGRLKDFTEWIHARTDPSSIGATWQQRSSWALTLLTDLLPHSNERTSWPETEVLASDRVEVLLRRIAVLDDLESGAPWAAFVRAVELELDAPAGSSGRIGTGVLVAPLVSAPGLDLDHVFILGLAEGVCPRPIREDTLLSDADRAKIAPHLATREDRLLEQRRAFRAAVAAGTKSATLVMPAGDHRNGRPRTASRWWLEAMRSLGAADDISARDWRTFELAELGSELSFTQGVEAAIVSGVATSPADLQLHHAITGSGRLEPSLSRSLNAVRRRGNTFDRFAGDLSGAPIPKVIGPEHVVSASRMETWATCPRRYFFAQVLGLGTIEAPDRIEQIGALDRGSMWHEILEAFIAESLPGQPHERSSPSHAWSADDRARLFEIAHGRFAKFEQAGLTGRPLLWRIEKEKLLADLARFIDSDSELRSGMGTTPHAVELAIGFTSTAGVESAEAAAIPLPDGRTLRVRGFADRVDVRSDGSPVVLDYKTGKAKVNNGSIRTALAKDPVVGGTKLQLGVYSEAAQQHYGTDRASAYYWFTSSIGEFEVAGYDWTADRRAIFSAAVGTITDGIEGGLFPPNPGDYSDHFQKHLNCRFCDFDPICPQSRAGEHEAALADRRLAPWLAMKDVDMTEQGDDQ